MTILLLAAAMTATAQIKTEIKTMNQAGPYAVSAPLALDTVDVKGNKFDEASLMSSIALTSPVTLAARLEKRGSAVVLCEQPRLSER